MSSSVTRFWRRLRYGTPIVVVSGLPRSGTSMAMKMLEAGGLSPITDGIRAADEDNPKGYYEDERVKNLAQDPDQSWLAEARGKVVKIISFLLKDLPPTHNYKVVFMRRDLSEVLASQAKMLDRRGEANETADAEMRAHFEDHLLRAKYWLSHSSHFEALYVDYSAVLAEPRREAERLAAFLDCGLDVERMVTMVDESLYRNRKD